MTYIKKIALLIAFVLAGLMAFSPLVTAQVVNQYWKLGSSLLSPVNSTYGLKIPALLNLACLGTDGSGVVGLGTCSGGGGASFGKTWEINNSGQLAPTSTIDVLAPKNLNASSSAIIGDNVKSSFFTATSTTATSSITNSLKIGTSLLLGLSTSTKQSVVGGGPERINNETTNTNDAFIFSGNLADANAKWLVQTNGLMGWGAGGASDQDINLYRSGAGALTIQSATTNSTDAFRVNQASGGTGTSIFTVNTTSGYISTPWILVNGAGGGAKMDVYGGGTTALRAEQPNSTDVAFSSFKTADAQLRFSFLADGTLKWSSGAAIPDIQLSRTAAGSVGIQGLNGTNSATAFNVLTAAGGSVFNVDASANRITGTYASTTAISTGYASTTNLIVSSAGGSGTRCAQFGADGTISANASACGSGGSSSPATSTNPVMFSYAVGTSTSIASTLPYASSTAITVTGSIFSNLGQGWIFSNGGTGALQSSTSPTVNYITATSTTKTSVYSGSVAIASTTGTLKVGVSPHGPNAKVDIVGDNSNVAGLNSVALQGWSPSFQVINHLYTLNYAFSMDDTSGRMWIVPGYGPNQGLTPGIQMDSSSNVYLNDLSVGNITINTSGNPDAIINGTGDAMQLCISNGDLACDFINTDGSFLSYGDVCAGGTIGAAGCLQSIFNGTGAISVASETLSGALNDSLSSAGSSGNILTSTGSATQWKSIGSALSATSTGSLRNQTVTVSSVNKYTPTASSTYEIAVAATVDAVTANTLTITCTFTNTNGVSSTATFFPMGLTTAGLTTTGSPAFSPLIITPMINTAMTVVATVTGVGSIKYDVDASIIPRGTTTK